MEEWGQACECGEAEQTADHIINTCLLCRPPSEVGLFQVGPETRAWLRDTELNVWTRYTREEAPYLFFTWCKQRLLEFNVIIKQSGSVSITSFNSKCQILLIRKLGDWICSTYLANLNRARSGGWLFFILFSTLAASPSCVKYRVES